MLDEWEFSSNFLSYSPVDQSSLTFYPNTESLAQQNHSAIITPALFPSPSYKRQCLESIPVHDIPNCLGIFGDSGLSSSGPPLQLPLNESAIRSLNLQECLFSSQTSSPEYNPSEAFDSSQSQFSYSSESDRIRPDYLLAENYGAPIVPGTQLLSKDIESQHQIFQNLTAATRGTIDQLQKTDSSESVFGDLSYPGLFSNSNVPIVGNISDVSRPPIPFVTPSSIERSDQFSNSPSTHRKIGNKAHIVGREMEKNKVSSGNNTSKIKRFPCPECGQKFARAFNLQTHIATHAGTRPFSCPADGCFKAFSRRHDLGRHMTAVHDHWLAVKNLCVGEATKSLHWRKNKNNSSHGHRNRSKYFQQS